MTNTSTITLNGSFTTESGNSPSAGWSVHTFTNATFNLLKAGATNSYFATDFVTSATEWPIFTATAANGFLSDQGPAAAYPGGTCPFFFNCLSAQPAGNGAGVGVFGLFPAGTNIFNTGTSLPSFPSLANAANYPLISGTATQTNPSSGLGFDNGMDAFALQGVLDIPNTQGNGTSQLFPDGVGGRPGIVRIMTTSSTGNTMYMVQGHVVYVDSDTDGKTNYVDNCRLVANPLQQDANADGYGNICDADINNSGTVTTADFGLLRSVLGQTAGSSATAAASDMNSSGTVTTADFGLLRARLGTAPGPSGLLCAGTIPCPAP